jgi:hypothetical protein
VAGFILGVPLRDFVVEDGASAGDGVFDLGSTEVFGLGLGLGLIATAVVRCAGGFAFPGGFGVDVGPASLTATGFGVGFTRATAVFVFGASVGVLRGWLVLDCAVLPCFALFGAGCSSPLIGGPDAVSDSFSTDRVESLQSDDRVSERVARRS